MILFKSKKVKKTIYKPKKLWYTNTRVPYTRVSDKGLRLTASGFGQVGREEAFHPPRSEFTEQNILL